MTNDALMQVLLRRERIIQSIAQQRNRVAIAVAGLERPIAIIDGVAGAARVLRAHPAAAVALLAGVLVLRARSVIGLVGRGIKLWRLYRSMRALLGHFAR